MTFTETPFLFLVPAVYALWLATRHNTRARTCVLLTGSLVFYGYHHWPLLALVGAYCLVDWLVGCRLTLSRRPGLLLALGVTFNLAGLAYWKYTPLLLRTLAQLTTALDLPTVAAPPDDWVIPFGISFYAFTGIAYLVDVYRKVTPPETSFWRYTLSAVFFPHLVAGPILRPEEFLTKLRPETMPDEPQAPLEALLLLGRGFFKKMVLADRIAAAIDPFFAHVNDPSTAGVWALPYVWLYALQIYFDFAAYTDIARGLGLLFGFRWPENFNLPYLATSVQEFWRRWHMTLSRFLKDYLYIPLGGNRGGEWRTRFNLMATMLLGGLWHGASWSFVLWGGLHGLYLVVNRAWDACPLRKLLPVGHGLWRAACVVMTFHCVCLAWCFFRLTVLADSLACVGKWFTFDADRMFVGGSEDLSLWLALAAYGALAWLAYHVDFRSALVSLRRGREALSLEQLPAQVREPMARGFLWGFGVMLLVLAVLLSPGGQSAPFIYFQF
jgi:D-alanyl-lipoteichoic acid acyltransferase DltB (MBOAT superfamily)